MIYLYVALVSSCLLPHGTSLEVKFAVYWSSNTNTSRWSYSRTAAALTMGEESLKKEGIIGDDVHFSFLYLTDQRVNNQSFYSGETVKFYLEGVHAFIGPGYSVDAMPVGYLTSYWDLPFMSYGSTDTFFRNRAIYPTMIRLLADTSSLGGALEAIFQKYGWTRYAKIIDDSSAFCRYYDSAITEATRKVGALITNEEQIYFESSIGFTKDSTLRKKLLEMRMRARIIILCGANELIERDILLQAYSLSMIKEFVWFTTSTFLESSSDRPWYVENSSDNTMAEEAYRSVFDITWGKSLLNTERETEFRKEHPYKLAQPPWNNNGSVENGWTGSDLAPVYHDIVYMYGLFLNKSLEEGTDWKSGRNLFRFAQRLRFSGVSGEVYLDGLADRVPDFWFWDSNSTGHRQLSIVVEAADRIVSVVKAPDWNSATGTHPPDEPECGFRNQRCPVDHTQRDTAISVVFGLLAVCAMCGVGLAYYRKQKSVEDELSRMLWKVDYMDISSQNKKAGLGSQLSFYSQQSQSSSTGDFPATEKHTNQFFSKFGVFKGVQVAIKHLDVEKVDLNRVDHIELKEMRDLTHENINQFVGMCVDPPHICTLFAYCSKGSLMDLLENEDIKLDNVFKVSMIQDLCSGLSFIQHSYFKSHGLLKSSNCVIDSRWMLKITDFGLPHICSRRPESEYQRYRRLWWTAPELLRLESLPSHGTPKGDIYSLGIIVYEIGHRIAPYPTEVDSPRDQPRLHSHPASTWSRVHTVTDSFHLLPRSILVPLLDHVERVMRCESPPYRPTSDEQPFHANILTITTGCWREMPDDRPEIARIQKWLKDINKGKKLNLMDHMLGMMEKYANNLEELVESRTKELYNEKKKTDKLLYSMLPAMVADRLKIGKTVEPESFQRVTIYFSDIVGFTAISAASTPFQVVDLLNELYTTFDNCLSQFDVYKVETIGDAYMVVSGLPRRNGDRHAGEIADMALDLLDIVLAFEIRHMPEVLLMIRIGLHTGSCCAGVVGSSMPRYCLFGDTVNMASRMESNGHGLRIHISQACQEALAELDGYKTELRGQLDIKGKGQQTTYWLVGREGHTKRLPSESELNPVFRHDGLPLRGRVTLIM